MEMYRPQATVVALFLVALLMLVVCFAPVQSIASTDPSAEDVLNSVNGDQIVSTISDLEAIGTRAFYLNQSNEAAAYIYERFSQLGLDVEYQDFMAGSHPSKNVVATQKGSLDQSRQFLVGAHYDSENSMSSSLVLGQNLPAPGADDDASGIAAMIGIATVLQGLRLNYTVKYVAFGAEESGYDHSGGLKGSRHFAGQESAKNATYEESAILDMIGYRGSSVNHATVVINDDNHLANSMIKAVSDHDINVTISLVIDPAVSYSDHYSFWVAGYPSMLVCEAAYDAGLPYEFNPNYHTEDDTVDQLSVEQMTEVSKALLGGMLTLNGFASDESGTSIEAQLLLVALCVVTAVVILLYISKVRR